jgi:hypothetical protein
MSSVIRLYVVDEKKLPQSMPDIPDQEKYERLIAAVRSRGAEWAELAMSVRDFNRALRAMDSVIGGTEFLPIFAFNNSPKNVLGDDADCPPFGYFSPVQVRDLNACFMELEPDEVEHFERSGDAVLAQVFHAFQTSAEEAVARKHALAVLHL